MNQKIMFNQKEYWMKGDFEHGAVLHYVENCDEFGNLLKPFVSSFAHYFPGQGIIQNGVMLGRKDDVEFLTT